MIMYILKLKKSNVEREILQFHFTEWPDHGVPNYCLPVLQFILKSVAAVPENSGPAVIHCRYVALLFRGNWRMKSKFINRLLYRLKSKK